MEQVNYLQDDWTLDEPNQAGDELIQKMFGELIPERELRTDSSGHIITNNSRKFRLTD